MHFYIKINICSIKFCRDYDICGVHIKLYKKDERGVHVNNTMKVELLWCAPVNYNGHMISVVCTCNYEEQMSVGLTLKLWKKILMVRICIYDKL